MYEKAIPDPTAIDGMKLWDEILKAIVSAMPSQLFPLASYYVHSLCYTATAAPVKSRPQAAFNFGICLQRAPLSNHSCAWLRTHL